ncbi:MAG: adenylate/guanylate cyclase domain-containing protein [Spirochaetaceae bacterium]|jgi:adenylate cyclase|nr:adenylate/guanylate cyclase domain-containing protein [Spirochaetaceae bacterium]
MPHWRSALIGFSSAVLFSIFTVAGLFVPLENRIYDLFLRFRPKRERPKEVVFLDVDNEAIAFNGVFPWPRSVMADGLLRLKEYGARVVIFDIEYVDRGPQGVDAIYLEQGLPQDFNRTFSGISDNASTLINSLLRGYISGAAAAEYAEELSRSIDEERESLFQRAAAVARDNDEYLAKTSALFGNSWATLNLRSSPLEGEQASRRSMAQDLFSFPVDAAPDVYGGDFVDVLPPIPSFARAARGAGFTRAYVDSDGVRRRIDLTQRVDGFWYLQLAIAPLVEILGSPELHLERKKLTLKNARLPSGELKDIVIPLDSGGRMLLDWPLTSFENSYTHFSFAALSRLEQAEAEIERAVSVLSSSENLYAFSSYDDSIAGVPSLLYRVEELLLSAGAAKAQAVSDSSDAAFQSYLDLRGQAWEALYDFLDIGFEGKIKALGEELAGRFSGDSDLIREECAYLESAAGNLRANLEDFDRIQSGFSGFLEGKYCIVGQTDAGTTDIGVNPFYNEYVNVGTQGVVLDTILSESFISFVSPWWNALYTIAVTTLLIFSLAWLGPGLRAALGFLSTLVVLFASLFLFMFSGIYLGIAGPVMALLLAAVFREVIAHVISDREKKFIRKAFSTYVSDDVVKEIIADPSRLQLGGVKRHMSALFTDIRNFTTVAEKLEPEDLVSLLNRYLTAMSDVILKEKGTIDKYEGDAIIAFFGAPLDLADHAFRACMSAIAIKRTEKELNKTLLEDGLSPAPLLTRIGINTGSMVAGNMGTDNKMNYTIMGNTVNLASRLEGVNKQYGTWILAAESTIRETGNLLLTRRLDRVRVVGINEPVRIYELMETMEAAEDWQKEIAARFEEALILFEKQDWAGAAKDFGEITAFAPADNPSRFYLKRCEDYLKNPPGADWDGVFDLLEK